MSSREQIHITPTGQAIIVEMPTTRRCPRCKHPHTPEWPYVYCELCHDDARERARLDQEFPDRTLR